MQWSPPSLYRTFKAPQAPWFHGLCTSRPIYSHSGKHMSPVLMYSLQLCQASIAANVCFSVLDYTFCSCLCSKHLSQRFSRTNTEKGKWEVRCACGADSQTLAGIPTYGSQDTLGIKQPSKLVTKYKHCTSFTLLSRQLLRFFSISA